MPDSKAENRSVKKRWHFNLIVSFLAGALVLALSPSPHDMFYAGTLFVAGVILGFALPWRFWIHYAGVFLGQLTYSRLVLGEGKSFLILLSGFGILIVYYVVSSLIALVGAAIGAGLRRWGSPA